MIILIRSWGYSNAFLSSVHPLLLTSFPLILGWAFLYYYYFFFSLLFILFFSFSYLFSTFLVPDIVLFCLLKGFVVVSLLNCVWLFCDPVDCSLPCSFIQEISQARIQERVASSFSRGSSRSRIESISFALAGRFFFFFFSFWQADSLWTCAYQNTL